MMAFMVAGALSVGLAGLVFAPTALAEDADELAASALEISQDEDSADNSSPSAEVPIVLDDGSDVANDGTAGTVDGTSDDADLDDEIASDENDTTDEAAVSDAEGATVEASAADEEENELNESATALIPPVTATLSNDQKSVTLVAEGINDTVTRVMFPVWSQVNGQDDLIWHAATKRADGTWAVTIALSTHKGTGAYLAHCYTVVYGQYEFFGSTAFELADPEADVEVSGVNSVTGTYTVTISGIESPSGITKVQVPTWVKNDQSDIKWYTATKNGDGTYSYTVPVADHAWAAGTYRSHVYVTDGNGNLTCVGGLTQNMAKPATFISASVNATETAATLVVVVPYNATAVKVPVWSNVNGQDDLVWHQASRQADGSWIASIPINTHKGTGAYTAHCYVTSNGKQSCVGGLSFEVTAPTAELAISDVDYIRGAYTVTVSGIESPSGITKVQMPTWVKNDQSDIKWYTATKQADGTYTFTIPMSDHAWDVGSYRTHVYVTAGNGILSCVGGVKQDMQSEVTAELDSSQEHAALTIRLPYAGASVVKVPVWSVNGGQNDIVWYTATKQADGTYTVTVPILDHKSTGKFNVHVYATVGGSQHFAGNTSFNVTRPIATVKVTSVNTGMGTFTITVSGIESPTGVAKVQIPTWSATGGQDDIKWYQATANANGTYTLTVDITASPHNSTMGQYISHCYITNNEGKLYFVGAVTQTMTPGGTAGSSNSGYYMSGATGQRTANGLYGRADAVNRMIDLVTDPSHGYDQAHRDGPDYDCSSSVCEAYGASHGNTSSIPNLFRNKGASVYTWDGNMADLEPGDLVGRAGYHVVMYIGNGKIAEFCMNENGGITGGQTGDQTGNESRITNFYVPSGGWGYVISPNW